ncbi:hypothetical protein Sano_12 [Xylella phage Sano]|uniref:Uncharacterized protein n=1 Tax=Xylella phage Sano TaxID=1415148 RepID=V5Q7C2_9CAUD|nr:hypothetical protein FGG50_gp12 [Xylella phage Sano]AHB12032.1 hypothetical protein Sano_12 [Xylella phage Sano]
MNATNRTAAIREAAALADSIIEQRTRLAAGWDQGMKRDDEPRFTGVTPRMRMERDSAAAFALSAQFATDDVREGGAVRNVVAKLAHDIATPVTDTEIRAAADRAMALARDTLAQRRPFLGVFGAADESGIADAAMAKVCGYAYLAIIQNNTVSITTDADGMLTKACLNRAGVILAAGDAVNALVQA